MLVSPGRMPWSMTSECSNTDFANSTLPVTFYRIYSFVQLSACEYKYAVPRAALGLQRGTVPLTVHKLWLLVVFRVNSFYLRDAYIDFNFIQFPGCFVSFLAFHICLFLFMIKYSGDANGKDKKQRLCSSKRTDKLKLALKASVLCSCVVFLALWSDSLCFWK